MAHSIAQFTVTPDSDGDYTLLLEDEEGETIEFTASYEQLELVAAAIDEALDSEEEDGLDVDSDADEPDAPEA